MRAENVLRDAAAKRCAKTFALWSLHQYDKNHQGGDQHEEHEAKVDQQVHWEAKYGEHSRRRKRRTSNIQRRSQRRLALSVGRWTLGIGRLLNLIPDRIHLGQFHFAQFPAARFEFVL